MKKRILFLSLTIVLILGIIPLLGIVSSADDVFQIELINSNRDGSFSIRNSSDWKYFADDVMHGRTFFNETIYLETDITISEPVGRWNSNETVKKSFRGTFDGKGHTITINYSGTLSDVGVFSATSYGAVIRNLTVEGKVEGCWSVGGIVGNAPGTTFENCINRAKIYGSGSNVGGIAGWSGNGTKFINCTNYGAVISDGQMVGGIAGIATNNAVFADCLNTQSVKGKEYVGGIVGYANSSVQIYTSMNDGSVSGMSGFVGGIAGYLIGGKIEGSVNNGKVSSSNESSFGTGGILSAGQNCTVTHSVNKGEVLGTNSVGGIVGLISNTNFSVVSCVNCGVVRNPSASKNIGSGAGGIAGFSMNQQKGYIRLCANYGNVYGYESVSGIAGVSKGAIVSCVSTCSASGSKKVGVISGHDTFTDNDGVYGNPLDQSFTIMQLNNALTGSDKQDGNYWGYDSDGLIVPILTKGLGSKRFPYTVTTPDELAMLSQIVNGGCNDFHNYDKRIYVRLDADIFDKDAIIMPIGGINAPSGDSEYQNSFKGVFDGNGHTVYLKMSVTGNVPGGLFGRTYNASIRNLRIAGSVSGEDVAGGIIGNAKNTYIINCQNDANVVGKKYVSGLVGYFTTDSNTSDSEKYIVNCISRGNVTATDDYAGAIVGFATNGKDTLHNIHERCLAIGSVKTAESPSISYNVTSYLSRLLKKLPEEFFFDVSDSAKKACGGIKLYTIAVCGENIGFKEFDLENKEYADAYYPGKAPTFESDGHKGYWYSYFDNAYYEDENCKTEINKDRLDAWLTVGHGFLEKLDSEKTYIIDGKLFTSREAAEEYLHDHCNDGISTISLGGDITTTVPIKLKGNYKDNTVLLNGHTWTYRGKDESSIFIASEYGTRLRIYGYSEEKRKELEKDKSIIDIIGENPLNMPTIQVDPNYRCRLLVVGNTCEITTDYVRILNTSSMTNGGAIYSTSTISMDARYTVFDHSTAWENGGALYFEYKSEFERTSYITLNNTVFRECSANKNGGAIYAATPMDLKGVNSAGFISCHADKDSGGAIAVYAYGMSTITTSTIKNLFFEKCYCGELYNINFLKSNSNEKVRGGGAISILDNPCKVYNCEFSSCISDGCGGSIYAILAKNSGVYDSNFINSFTVKYGQDIYIQNPFTWAIDWELKNIMIKSMDYSSDLIVNVSENDMTRGKNVRIVAVYLMQPYVINLKTENITRSNSTFYSSILSEGSIVAVIVGGVLVIAATVGLLVWKKRKKGGTPKEEQKCD